MEPGSSVPSGPLTTQTRCRQRNRPGIVQRRWKGGSHSGQPTAPAPDRPAYYSEVGYGGVRCHMWQRLHCIVDNLASGALTGGAAW